MSEEEGGRLGKVEEGSWGSEVLLLGLFLLVSFLSVSSYKSISELLCAGISLPLLTFPPLTLSLSPLCHLFCTQTSKY